MSDRFTVTLSKLDETFSIQETKNYGLFIQFNESGLTVCILDYYRNKFLGIQQIKRNEFHESPGKKIAFHDFLNDVVTEIPWLIKSYKSVKIAYEGKKSTLIPGPLYDPNDLEDYLKFNFSSGPDEKPFSDHLVLMDNYNVFSVPVSTAEAMAGIYPDSRIHHLSSILIESVMINYKNRINAERVFLHLREKSFDLMLFDGRRMSYFNSFPYLNEEDIAYYLIFVLEQLNINPETIPVVLLGKAELNSNLCELLQRYIRHCEFGRQSENFQFSPVFNELPPHSFYPLLNFVSCGS